MRNRSIETVMATLAGHRRRWEQLIRSRADHAPAQDHDAACDHLIEVRKFGSNPGALRMFKYVPANPEPALVVVLHSCTQTAGQYDLGAGWSTLADRYGFVLLLPQQQAANNPNVCFNWFLPDDMERHKGEAASIHQMVERMVRDHGIDRGRVFVTGLSAGGAMTAVMLAAYPETFAAGAVIAGLPYGTAKNVNEAFESMFQVRPRAAPAWGDLVRAASPHRGPWPRLSVWHGSADPVVKPQNAEEIVKQWTDVHGLDEVPTQTEIVDGYPRQVWRDRAGEAIIEHYTISQHGARHAARDRRRRRAVRRPGRLPARGRHFVVLSHRQVLGPDRPSAPRCGQAEQARVADCGKGAQPPPRRHRDARRCARACGRSSGTGQPASRADD